MYKISPYLCKIWFQIAAKILGTKIFSIEIKKKENMGYMQNYKRTYLDTEIAYRKEGITFIPLVSEADGGGWGPAGQAVWKELAKQKSIVSGKPDSITAGHLLQTLGIILHKENARVILRCSPNNNIENNKRIYSTVGCFSSLCQSS